MKLRSFYSALIGVVVVLLLASAAGAYWLTAGPAAPVVAKVQTVRARPTRPTGTMFVSRQAPVMLSLLANPEQLTDSWVAEATPARRKLLQSELEQVPQNLFSELELDYERDLKAWLGSEVTFALMSADIDRDATNGAQPGYLLVLSVDQPQQAQEAMRAFWQRRSSKNQVTQFAGIEIVTAGAEDATSDLTSAMVGNQYVLFANAPQVLRTALNNAQVPDLSLEKSFTYQQALEQVGASNGASKLEKSKPGEPKLGYLFADLSQTGLPLAGPLADLLPSVLPSILPSTLTDSAIETPALEQSSTQNSSIQKPQPYASLIAALRSTPIGLLADTLLVAAEPMAAPAPKLVDANALLKFVPTLSSLAVASQDLPQTWQQWQWLLEPTWKSGLQTLQQQMGITLPETASSWVQGKFALAQVPHPGAASDWLLVTEQSPEFAAGLLELDQLAQAQGMSLGSFELKGRSVYAWTKLIPRGSSLQAEVQGVRTQSGNYEVLATSLEALEQALSPNLTAFPQAQFQVPNQGYLYFDRRALEQAASANGLKLKPNLLNGVRSALISSYGKTETGIRGTVLLNLKGA
jgi:hypothetical protein